MAAAILKAGTAGPHVTGEVNTVSDKNSTVVTVEGPYESLKSANRESYVPDGYTLESSTLSPDGNGLGKLTLNCIKYDSGDSSGFSAVRTTFRIDMAEVQYDLEDHPSIAGARDTILKWLATDEAKRVDGDSYRYTDANGELQPVEGDDAIKFCKAYMAGIKTFNRYFPVIEKISTWKNPPGLSMSGRSFTGGSPTFDAPGTYDDPPISLNGFPSGHWFKSKDSWVQNENRTWTRTEQWTYTPEASSGQHGWIYNDL